MGRWPRFAQCEVSLPGKAGSMVAYIDVSDYAIS